MTFTKPWIALPGEEGQETRVPAADVYLRTRDGRLIREIFVVDSGADVSLGPRTLCDMLGLAWEIGSVSLPFCFATGDAPLLLGRDGFFDAFGIHFDKRKLLTTFAT